MEFILERSIVTEIDKYKMHWIDAIWKDNIPDTFWEQIYNRYLYDDDFRVSYIDYIENRDPDIEEHDVYREKFLDYIFNLIEYPCWIPDILQQDRNFILFAVRRNGYVLEYVTDYANDREIVLEAVKSYGATLEHVNELFKQDREIVLEAVKNNGYALEHANNIFKQDKEIVLEAVKNRANSIEYAADNLKSDPDVLIATIYKYGKYFTFSSPLLKYTPDSLKANPEFLARVEYINPAYATISKQRSWNTLPIVISSVIIVLGVLYLKF